MERWQTYPIALQGGLMVTTPPVKQGMQSPGSLSKAVNFETSRKGGYRRLSGYAKFDNFTVPGTDRILGAFVFKGLVLACRNDKIYESGGSGWTEITSTDLNTGALKYAAERFNWGTEEIILVDKVNKPFKYDGTTLTRLTSAPSGVTDLKEFKRHMFLAHGNKLTFSSPNDTTDYTAANGAGEINVGFEIIAVGKWRDQLYIFGRNNISKILGNNKNDFVLSPVTQRIGIVHRDTLREVGSNLLFLADDGVRTVAGTERIGDVELGSVSEPIYPLVNTLASEYQSGEFTSIVLSDKSQYRLFFNNSTDSKETAKGIIGCLNTSVQGQSYEWFELRAFQVACGDSDYTNNVEIVVHGDYDGYIYQQEVGNSFDGDNVLAYFQTPYITYNDPELRKTIYKMRIFANIEGDLNPSVGLKFDYENDGITQPADLNFAGVSQDFATYGSASYGAGKYGSTQEVVYDFNTVGSGLNNAFIIVSNDQKAPYSIQELLITYASHARR